MCSLCLEGQVGIDEGRTDWPQPLLCSLPHTYMVPLHDGYIYVGIASVPPKRFQESNQQLTEAVLPHLYPKGVCLLMSVHVGERGS